MSLPVDFEAKLKAPPSASGSGYPAQISAADLMQNFVYAAGEFKEEDFEVTDSKGKDSQHTTRKIALKNSLTGTDQGEIPFWDKSLNDNAGGWQMIKPTQQGEFLFWNKDLNNQQGGWDLVTVSSPGAFLVWDEDANGGQGGWVPLNPTGEGTMIYYSAESKKWEFLTPTDNSVIFYKDKTWQSLAVPAEETHVLGSVNGVLTWIATEEC